MRVQKRPSSPPLKNMQSTAGRPFPSNNEGGFILVAALIFLVLLVALGVSATKTTTIELQIAGNDKVAAQNFYKAEGAARENLQTLENASTEKLRNHTVAGLVAGATVGVSSQTSASQIAAIANATLSGSNLFANSALDIPESPTRNLAIDRGVSGGSSLSMTESQVHIYEIYGYSAKNNGTTIINLGYKKRW